LLQLIQLSVGQLSNTGVVSMFDRHWKIHLQQIYPSRDRALPERYRKNLVFGSFFDGVQYPISWLARKMLRDKSAIRD